MESLEGRTLMAGFVDVSLSGGTLFLRGDAASNGVAVVGTGVAGQFAIVGHNNVVGAATPGDVSSATTLRFNGASVAGPLVLNGVVNINADLGAGNDQIGVTGGGAAYYGAVLLNDYATNNVVVPPVSPAAGTATSLQGSISIVTGNGNDAVALLVNTPNVIAVDTGAGNDYAVLESSSTLNLAINTGAGDSSLNGSDRVRVRNTNVQIAVGVNTYAGNDIVDVFGSSAQTIAINTFDNGGLVFPGVNPAIPEAVRLIGVNAQTVGINTHGGSDQVIIAGGIAGFSLNSTTIGVLGINTFDGNDLVQIFSGNATPVVVTQQATITTDSGNDTVETTNLQVFGYLWIDLGDGNDTFRANTTLATYSFINGSTGFDTYDNNGGNSLFNLYFFEAFI
jgi:hypothetical protein